VKLLDLFCGAGGAAVGYHRAGFTDIVGVDHRPMPRYPFQFVQADALEYLACFWPQFDVIHASPPCQRYSMMSRNLGTSARYPDLVEIVVGGLERLAVPFVVENVPGAPIRPSLTLRGSHFGLRLARHRHFQSNIIPFNLLPPCAHHDEMITAYGSGTPVWMRERRRRQGKPLNIRNDEIALAMGIDWMTRAEMDQAIPPAYTEFIGKQLLQAGHAPPAAQERVS
jgi:DNA (cytosine-5)-methyltransferase 1